jgi:hypothetical protein
MATGPVTVMRELQEHAYTDEERPSLGAVLILLNWRLGWQVVRAATLEVVVGEEEEGSTGGSSGRRLSGGRRQGKKRKAGDGGRADGAASGAPSADRAV